MKEVVFYIMHTYKYGVYSPMFCLLLAGCFQAQLITVRNLATKSLFHKFFFCQMTGSLEINDGP